MNKYFHTVKPVLIKQALTAHQAIEDSAVLGRLASLIKESSARLKAIESLIPETLRPAVKAGPIDDETWCLLVTGNAAAAKIRQLMPLIESRLRNTGWKVTSIRLKILMSNKQ